MFFFLVNCVLYIFLFFRRLRVGLEVGDGEGVDGGKWFFEE